MILNYITRQSKEANLNTIERMGSILGCCCINIPSETERAKFYDVSIPLLLKFSEYSNYKIYKWEGEGVRGQPILAPILFEVLFQSKH